MTEVADLGERLAVYRFSLKELVRPTFYPAGAVSAITLVRGCIRQDSSGSVVAAVLLAAAGTTLGVGIILAIAPLCFAVIVFEHGLRAQTRSGRSVTVRWSDVSGVERRTVWGIPHVRIVARSGLASDEAWVPAWVVEEPSFRALVRTHAGADNPLAS